MENAHEITEETHLLCACKTRMRVTDHTTSADARCPNCKAHYHWMLFGGYTMQGWKTYPPCDPKSNGPDRANNAATTVA